MFLRKKNIMSSDKHCEIDLTDVISELTRLYANERKLEELIQEIEKTGKRKFDYGNGIVVLKITGKKTRSSNTKYLHRHVTYGAGVRVICTRTDLLNGVQQLKATCKYIISHNKIYTMKNT